jgi:fumarate hydratase class I
MERLEESLGLLIEQTSTLLPPDVRRALGDAVRSETPGSRASLALSAIASNVDLACDRGGPLCHDTGLPSFEVRLPPGMHQLPIAEAVHRAVAAATRRGVLPAHAKSPVTRATSHDNVGAGTPLVSFEEWQGQDIEVRLLLRGGGSENASAQYSLPCELPVVGRAERDLEGVRKCVLHAVHAAQGRACGLGILGVAVGGDRSSGHRLARQQLLRPLDDVSSDPLLARLEAEIVSEANRLGIGAMGLGGRVTALGCKIAAYDRPASSYFVTVAYGCWALRRFGVTLDVGTGAIKGWLYWDAPAPRMASRPELPLAGSVTRLTTPLSEDKVRGLKAGDVVLLSGVVHTGREMLHHYLVSHDPPISLRGAALLHATPLASRRDAGWEIDALGPTASAGEEPWQADVIRRYGVRAVIGKGGMGPRTLAALEECGAVYLQAIGGGAQFYAERIERVEGVHLLEFGPSEAMWQLRVKDFPAVVTMDAHGRSLHAEIEARSAEALASLGRCAAL